MISRQTGPVMPSERRASRERDDDECKCTFTTI